MQVQKYARICLWGDECVMLVEMGKVLSLLLLVHASDYWHVYLFVGICFIWARAEFKCGVRHSQLDLKFKMTHLLDYICLTRLNMLLN